MDTTRGTLDLLGVHDVKLTFGMTIAPDLQYDISKKMERAGAEAVLLAAVGSWGDTVEAKEVLGMLREWNDTVQIARQLQLQLQP